MFRGVVVVVLLLWAAKSERSASNIPATEVPALVSKERRVIPFRSVFLIVLPNDSGDQSSSAGTIPATTDQRAIHHRRGVPLRLPVLRAQGTKRRQ